MHEDYKELAKKMTEKLIDSLVRTVKSGDCPDLYWKLEDSLFNALKYADARGAARAKEEYTKLIQQFDADNGPSQN